MFEDGAQRTLTFKGWGLRNRKAQENQGLKAGRECFEKEGEHYEKDQEQNLLAAPVW
jgi:hypothetical protein